MPPPTPLPPGRRRGWFLILLVIAVAAGAVGWFALRPRGAVKPAADLTAAVAANTRGVGLMNKFEYAKAAEAFGQAEAAVPDWLPAKINRGIALYNLGGGSDDVRSKSSNLSLAMDLFNQVLAVEPDNLPAVYNLGIIRLYLNDTADAARHFARVTDLDPKDPHGWYLRVQSMPDGPESAAAKGYLETALKLNPYLNPARYALAQHALTSDADRKRLLAEFEALQLSHSDVEYVEKYTDMGKYAFVIGAAPVAPAGVGPVPMFTPADVTITPPPAWASAAALGSGPDGDLRRGVRARFGGTLIHFDYNRDGRPDILMLSAVVRDGKPADLLLRNDGDGKFTDVTAAVGLTGASLGAAAGDFDNDTYPDLALTSPTGVRVWRNDGGTKFVDVSAAAGADKLTGVYLSAAWADLDLDGDLDLILAKYAADPAAAAVALAGGPAAPGGQLAVLLNVGESRPGVQGPKVAPLATAFCPATGPDALLLKGPVTGVIVTDIDGDIDPDLVVLIDGRPPAVVLNDRLMRFHAGPPLAGVGAARWNGGLVVDANGDEQSDLVLLPAGEKPILLVSQRDAPDLDADLGSRFAPTANDLPAFAQAHAADLDRDGRPDLCGLTAGRTAAFAQSEGRGRLVPRRDPFGPAAAAVPDLLAARVVDFDGDFNPDLVAWSESKGLMLFRGSANGNAAVRVGLSGVRERREPSSGRVLRTNADGLGTRVSVYAGPVRSAVEVTTLSAGLGQSLGPIDIGVGPAKQADVLRFRWPDALAQAELDQAAGQLLAVTETSRKPTSCPVLLVWDGTKFAYVTDFLGAGALGELGPDGSVRLPRPQESVKIEPGRMALRDGRYVLKIAEPMDEVLYLDAARLDVIDHPAGVHVYPDERFITAGPAASQKLLAFRDAECIFPATATDHAGRDVTATLAERDGKYADGFRRRSWLGYAEEHFVELDFGDCLKSLPAGRPVYLVLAGWTDYPYPESMYAATQAGVPTLAPVLEQKQRDGSWKHLADVGFPAGLPRVMTRDVTGLVDPAGGPVRVRTNLQIYWDQVYIAPAGPVESVTLPPTRATLAHRGFIQEVMPTGRPPVAYDDGKVEPVAVTRWKGQLTRLGDVTELLTGVDDRLTVSGPGDELTIEFDASKLPAVRPGQVRSWVLRADGYTKDTAMTTMSGGTVGPLPFRGMTAYPYPAGTPQPAGRAEDVKRWQTRPAGGR